MRSKHRKKESESSFLGVPKFYTSYEKKGPPRCPTCERRYGIYGVIDSFVPYLKCMCSWSGETCWTPGYGRSDLIRGFKRWKGCRNPGHWSYSYAANVNEDALPDYINGLPSKLPLCDCNPERIRQPRNTIRSSKPDRRRRHGNYIHYVTPYVEDASTSTSENSRLRRQAREMGHGPGNDPIVIVVGDQVRYSQERRRNQYERVRLHHIESYAPRPWEPLAGASRALWRSNMKKKKKKEASLLGRRNEQHGTDFEPLIDLSARDATTPVKSTVRFGNGYGRSSREGRGRPTGKASSAKHHVPKHVHFR